MVDRQAPTAIGIVEAFVRRIRTRRRSPKRPESERSSAGQGSWSSGVARRIRRPKKTNPAQSGASAARATISQTAIGQKPGGNG